MQPINKANDSKLQESAIAALLMIEFIQKCKCVRLHVLNCETGHRNSLVMIRTILFLILMHSLNTQAEVVHHIQFCAGNFCTSNKPLTMAQQLELNQQFEEGNLRSAPSIADTNNNQSPVVTSELPNTPQSMF